MILFMVKCALRTISDGISIHDATPCADLPIWGVTRLASEALHTAGFLLTENRALLCAMV